MEKAGKKKRDIVEGDRGKIFCDMMCAFFVYIFK